MKNANKLITIFKRQNAYEKKLMLYSSGSTFNNIKRYEVEDILKKLNEKENELVQLLNEKEIEYFRIHYDLDYSIKD